MAGTVVLAGAALCVAACVQENGKPASEMRIQEVGAARTFVPESGRVDLGPYAELIRNRALAHEAQHARQKYARGQ